LNIHLFFFLSEFMAKHQHAFKILKMVATRRHTFVAIPISVRPKLKARIIKMKEVKPCIKSAEASWFTFELIAC
jgi:hypothetical protein